MLLRQQVFFLLICKNKKYRRSLFSIKVFLGPQGTGGLCFRRGLEIRPWKTGGTGVGLSLEQPSQYPTRLEAGTLNGHGLAGPFTLP